MNLCMAQILVDKEAAVGCGLIEGYAILRLQIWTSVLRSITSLFCGCEEYLALS